MKNLAPILIALLFVIQTFSQVGINTTNPTATLDVNGNIRIRDMNSSYTDSEAEKIVGMDEYGNFVMVVVDDNLKLEHNELQVDFGDGNAVEIVGLDEDGNFVEVEVGENVILEGNKLRVVENKYRFASVTVSGEGLNNMDLLILPGEPNDDKKIIRMYTPNPFAPIEITGILAGDDGQTVWLYIQDSSVKLMGLNNASDPENQFLIPGQLTLQQYDMIQLMYDGNLQKWVVMDY